jgi:hypothetical protein
MPETLDICRVSAILKCSLQNAVRRLACRRFLKTSAVGV